MLGQLWKYSTLLKLEDWMQPTIVFDIDGTLTDYKEFIKKRPFPYFEKKYAMKAVHPCELEPEDIFDI